MTTLVLFTSETCHAVEKYLNDPEKQAQFRTPEAKAAYAAGVERVKRMAAARRRSLAVNPDIYRQKIDC